MKAVQFNDYGGGYVPLAIGLGVSPDRINAITSRRIVPAPLRGPEHLLLEVEEVRSSGNLPAELAQR